MFVHKFMQCVKHVHTLIVPNNGIHVHFHVVHIHLCYGTINLLRFSTENIRKYVSGNVLLV